MGKYMVGIDFGTGGAKACIIDEDADVLAYAFREYPIYTNNLGHSEHDPAKYWPIACEIIGECIKKSGIDSSDIRGVANSSALPSLVMVDNEHNPIDMAYNLLDRRATSQVEWLRQNFDSDFLFSISCNRLEDHPSMVNLMWEKQNRPDIYKKIYKALTIDGYIRLKLTGKATSNFSAGAWWGVAYDVRKNEINGEVMDKIGLDMSIMPDFFSCEEIVGTVTGSASRETGLPEGIPVSAGSVDCNAGWLGGGSTDVGDIQINLGTCGVMGVIHQNPDLIVDSMLNCTYTTDSRSTFAMVAATTTGGQALRYMRDTFSPVEVMVETMIKGLDSYDLLNMEAESIPPGSESLIILPYFSGERTPIWDVDSRGVIFGISLNHSKAHYVRAMMESVAYSLYDNFLIMMQSCSKVNLPIVMNEGGAKSKLWRRIITDVFNVPTVFLKSRIGAPLGDAILAGVSCGVFRDFRIAKEKAVYIERIDPIEENHRLYEDHFKLYRKLYSHLKEDFRELTNLRGRYAR
ncbi:MAG: FGGY-family carbohydrate kinase [Synergistaceae bacterium]|jgi:xylulokinase|nr:FGGY-family carbohydrate kinase [Synergistaceae bacterium]